MNAITQREALALRSPARDDLAEVVIGKLEEVPQGAVISGDGGAHPLSMDRQIDLVILSLGSGKHVTVLVSVEAYGKPVMFDMLERLRQADMVPHARRATRDVIALVYERDSEGARSVEIDQTNVESLITSILDDAAAQGASDIHIEQRPTHANVIIRVNGERTKRRTLAPESALKLAQVLYDTKQSSNGGKGGTGWNVYEPFDARIDWVLSSGEQVELRFSSTPAHPKECFKIVLRFTGRRGEVVDLADLGYSANRLAVLESLAVGGKGLVLMVGPQNSGKSTALDGMVEKLYQARGPMICVLMVQQPIEREHAKATQIPLPDGEGRQEVLRTIVRQDPDVLVMGEIRDSADAAIAKDQTLIGKKTFGSLHAFSALWAFVRLREMGVTTALLTMPGFIAGICYQRLLPKLCGSCSTVLAGETHIRGLFTRLTQLPGYQPGAARLRGLGCNVCKGTGYVTRVPVSEIVVPDKHLLRLIGQERYEEAEAYWLTNGSANPAYAAETPEPAAIDEAIRLVLAGEVSPVDVEVEIGPLVGTATSARLAEGAHA